MKSSCIPAFAAVWIALTSAGAVAQTGAVYVNHEKVDAALAGKGGVLIDGSEVKVAAGHRDKPGALETQKDTTIVYVTDGEATFVAGGQDRQLHKGDVLVVPGGTPQAFKAMPRSISYYLVTVPDRAAQAGLVTYVDHEKVAATLKKAGPLADAPHLKVSGGYRTGPYAPADYRPDVEVHESEADLFYVIDGNATLVTGGTVVGGRTTAPGQIRGSSVQGGQTTHLSKGDVMWVPAGVAHWFPEIPQPLSYLLVKVLKD